jgi:hypothetical protein
VQNQPPAIRIDSTSLKLTPLSGLQSCRGCREHATNVYVLEVACLLMNTAPVVLGSAGTILKCLDCATKEMDIPNARKKFILEQIF